MELREAIRLGDQMVFADHCVGPRPVFPAGERRQWIHRAAEWWKPCDPPCWSQPASGNWFFRMNVPLRAYGLERPETAICLSQAPASNFRWEKLPIQP